MGSGWISAADALGVPTHEFSVTELPGFPEPTVAGHGGVIRSYNLQGPDGVIHALVFLGRTHLYEGKGIEPVVHGVRTAVKAGCQVVVLTNACGGINVEYRVGQPVILRDHISMTGVSPLIGADFVDLTVIASESVKLSEQRIHPWRRASTFTGAGQPTKLLPKLKCYEPWAQTW